MRTHAPKRDDRVKVLVSFPRAVLDRLDQAAVRAMRSRTSEVVMRVESTFWDSHGRIIDTLPAFTNEKCGEGPQ